MYLILEMLKNNIIKPLILFLLLSQFATLAHAIEHQFVQDVNEPCLICLHEVDSKNSLVGTFSQINFSDNTFEICCYEQHEFYSVTSSLLNIRSPPLSLK